MKNALLLLLIPSLLRGRALNLAAYSSRGKPSHGKKLRVSTVRWSFDEGSQEDAQSAPKGQGERTRYAETREATTPSSSSSLPLERQPLGSSYALLVLAATLAFKYPLPADTLVFSLAFPTYIFLANAIRFRFNAGARNRSHLPLLREGGGLWFTRYVLSFAAAGLLFPLVLCALGSSDVGRAAAPHLYLTLVQCACEGLTATPHFAALLRLAVPVGFNTFRIGTLCTWVLASLQAVRGSAGSEAAAVSVAAATGGTAPSLHPTWWARAGLALAVVNLLMWTYNLFVFLLLRVVPQYMDPREFSPPRTAWVGQLIPWATEEASPPA